MSFWKKFNNKTSNYLIKKLVNKKFRKFNFIEDSFYNHIRDIFALIIPLIQSNNKILKVLDYGGGNGVAIYNLFNKIDVSRVSFYVYDPFLVANKFVKKNKIKIYYSSNLIPYKKENFDLVYFGSSWQYLNNIKNIFNKINLKKKSYILISHTPFSISNSFSCKQLNHKSLIQNVHSFNGICKFFLKNNFKIIFKSLLDSKYSKVNKKFLHKTIYLNMLLKKKY